mgnify:CR=1 FL=1
MNDLIDRMKQGDRRALSRLLSLVERQDEASFSVLEALWDSTGKAFVVGVTGPAGAGKSTFIDQMIRLLRSEKLKVGVIAVDPSSPFSGGAVLGDRVRMQRHAQDPDVFIRSVGSRGRSGGISFATRALAQVMDAYGCDVILIETVGAGQSEVEIMNLADATLVLLMPEAGDSIQALKAGILEIADVYVVNKMDRPGADRVVQDIQTMISLAPNSRVWETPIHKTEAVGGEGVDAVWESLKRYRVFLETASKDESKERKRRWNELIDLAQVKFLSEVSKVDPNSEAYSDAFASKRANLYRLVDRLLAQIASQWSAKAPPRK